MHAPDYTANNLLFSIAMSLGFIDLILDTNKA